MAPRKSAKPVGPKKLWLEHQAAVLSQKGDLARVEYALEHFHDIRKAKAQQDALPEEKDVSRIPSWTGWKHLKSLGLVERTQIAEYLLGENWQGRKAVSSMFLMADQVLNLLGIKKYAWNEKYGVGRILLSALTYSGVYYLHRDDYGMNKPYYIYVSNKAQIKKKPRPSIKTREEKFPRWTSNVDELGNKLVRPSHPCLPEEEYVPKVPKDRIVPWLDAVHRLESVRFRINKQLLKWVEETDKKISTRIISKHLPGKKEKLDALDAEKKRIGLKGLEKKYVKKKDWAEYKAQRKILKDVEWKNHKGFGKPKDVKAWNQYWRKWNILQDNINRYEARRASFENHLEKAQELKDKPFYQRVSVDYRGRLYLPEFSYQGSDFCRAIIEFNSGDVITIHGWKHLLRHTADVKDGESRATDDKIEFGKSIAPDCMEIASDPIKNIDKWRNADKPFGFLRSCMEVRDAITPILRYQLEHGDKDQLKKTTRQETVAKARKWIKDHSANYKALELSYTGDAVFGEDESGEVVLPVDIRPLHNAYEDKHFVSRMPVAIDQNNSAFQHIALMMDDQSLADDTGLSGKFVDVYQEIADSREIPRKTVKLAIVPWSYGAGPDTIKKRVREYVDENPDKVPDLAWMTGEEIGNLVEGLIGTFENRFEACHRYKEDVYAAIKELSEKPVKNRPEFIQWRTPFDFVVHQRVHSKGTPQATVANGFEGDVEPQARQPTDSIDWGGMTTKAPPNLVHSYDAALIHGTLWSERFYVGLDDGGNRTAFSNQALDDYDIGGDPKEAHGSKPWIGPIITVHDSFACHASMLEELSQDLLHNLEQLYIDFDPLRIFMRDIRGSSQRERKREFKYQESNEWAG